MKKTLEAYNNDQLESMAKKTKVVRIDNKSISQEFTVSKKETATISRELVSLHNAFNRILASTTNVKALRDVQAKNMQTAKSISYVPVPAKIIGSQELTSTVKVLSKYFEDLAEKIKKLDLSPDTQDQPEEDGGADIDIDVGKKRRRTRTRGRTRRKLRGRGLAGKALGIFAVGMDIADRLGSGESAVQTGVGVAGGVAGGLAGAEVGAALGALGGPAAPVTVPLGGLIGGAIGYFAGGKVADTAYDAIQSESPAERQLQSAAAKAAVPPARREPRDIANNSYSSRFADYLSDTFENVKSYIGGIIGSIFGGGASDNNFIPDGPGAGMTANAQIAFDFFTSPQGGGWTKEQAAGIIANLQAESQLDPNAFNEEGGGNGAVGIAQWRGPRQTQFQQLYGRPIRGSSLQQQLAYVNWELNSGSSLERRAGTQLRQARTAEEATNTFYRLYERPGEDDRSGGRRIANAMAIMESASLTGGQLINPLPGARLSSGFGSRDAPTAGASTNHKGLDFAAPNGTPIRAAGSGTITFVGSKSGWGNTIEISHGNGLLTRYAHLSAFGVSQGMTIQAGQSIGAVGSTGRSTGNHLHFEVVVNGQQVNPRPYLTGATPQQAPSPAWRQAANWEQIQQMYTQPPRRGNGSLLVVRQPAPAQSQQPIIFPYAMGRGPITTNSNPRAGYLGYHGQ